VLRGSTSSSSRLFLLPQNWEYRGVCVCVGEWVFIDIALAE
jgi:hypothetical protein